MLWRQNGNPASGASTTLTGLAGRCELHVMCRRDDRSFGSSVGLAASLAMRAMPHEAVAPHELLPAAVAVVGLQTGVGLHVLCEVMLHLELLGTDRAVEGPQVQVHVDVAVPHALVRECLPAMTHEDLA